MKKITLIFFCFVVALLVVSPTQQVTATPHAPTKTEVLSTKKAKKEARKQAKRQKRMERFQKRIAKWYKKMANADNQILAVIVCFFLGVLGLHRVVMGGSGILILWYLITFGGIFGILPLIDFIRLIIDPEHYVNNNSFLAAFQ